MGWNSQNITNLLIIEAGGGFSGLFVYSPSPGPGNLVDSVTAQAGTDPYGNPYLKNISAYGPPLPPASLVPVQSKVGTGSGSSTLTITLTNPTTAGNTLVVAAALAGTTNPNITGITIGGSADHFASAIIENGTAAFNAEIWADPNCAGGQTSVVITVAGGSGTLLIDAIVYELPGLVTSSVVDRTSGNLNNSSGPTWTTLATTTTTQASEIAIAIVTTSVATTITPPGAPWVNTVVAASAVTAGYNVLSSAQAVTYNGTFSPNAAYTAAVATFKAAPAPTQQAIQIGTAGGVVVENLFTGTVSEAAPAQFKAGAFHVGTSQEQQAFTVAGATNTGSNDAVFAQFNSSSVASPNTAQGSLEYQLPAGGDALLVTWGAQGVSRSSLAGLSGGIALNQMDFFTRTINTVGVQNLTRNYSIPANDAANIFSQQTTYHLRAWGNGNGGNPAQNATWTINMFGTTIFTVGPSAWTSGAAHTFNWLIDVDVEISGNSATASFIAGGFMMFVDTTAGTTVTQPIIGGATVNNTAPGSMVLNWNWAGVVGGATISCPGSVFTRKGV